MQFSSPAPAERIGTLHHLAVHCLRVRRRCLRVSGDESRTEFTKLCRILKHPPSPTPAALSQTTRSTEARSQADHPAPGPRCPNLESARCSRGGAGCTLHRDSETPFPNGQESLAGALGRRLQLPRPWLVLFDDHPLSKRLVPSVT